MPKPTLSFTIPSIHDGTPLNCRVYLPKSFPDRRLKAAILAHPYASLGGSYDDPVVGFVTKELLSHGFVVGTFNFRGAQGSKGRTSWTGKPERKDYISFVGFMKSYLTGLGGMISDDHEERAPNTGQAAFERINLIIGGYSYGSLIVTHLPPIQDMLRLFQDPELDTAMSEIVREAKRFARDTKSRVSQSSHTSPVTADCGELRVQYLLISPLLPPVSFFLNPSFGSVFGGLGRSAELHHEATLNDNRTLAVFGSDDLFTSASKLQTWSRKTQTASNGLFEWLEVDGAGHFWREHGVEEQMRERIATWVSR